MNDGSFYASLRVIKFYTAAANHFQRLAAVDPKRLFFLTEISHFDPLLLLRVLKKKKKYFTMHPNGQRHVEKYKKKEKHSFNPLNKYRITPYTSAPLTYSYLINFK